MIINLKNSAMYNSPALADINIDNSAPCALKQFVHRSILPMIILSLHIFSPKAIVCAAIIQNDQEINDTDSKIKKIYSSVNNPSILMIAIIKNDKKKVKSLISQGVKVNNPIAAGWSPLMWACRGGNEQMVKLLLDLGADINDANDKGYSVLMWAAIKGNKEIVETLLKAGADIECKNKDNKNAIDLAKENNRQEIVKMLEDEPQRRENKILECQKIISNQISNLADKPLINDVIPLISQYAVGSYEEFLEFEKSNPNIIEMLLKANETLNSNNKLKRKTDSVDESDLVDKKTKLSQSAKVALINELKEKRESINKEIAIILNDKDGNKIAQLEKKQEEIIQIDEQIKKLSGE